MDEFYTVNQVAIVLKVHPLTIRRYIKEGKLKAYKVGGNVRVSVNDLRIFTQNFIPHHQKINKASLLLRNKSQSVSQANSFSFSDPILTLKGKGLSMSKLEQE